MSVIVLAGGLPICLLPLLKRWSSDVIPIVHLVSSLLSLHFGLSTRSFLFFFTQFSDNSRITIRLLLGDYWVINRLLPGYLADEKQRKGREKQSVLYRSTLNFQLKILDFSCTIQKKVVLLRVEIKIPR